MAAFKVLADFRAPTEGLKHLPPGGVYAAGDTISGLTAAEAYELLQHAPPGTFAAVDAEGETVSAKHAVRLNGSLNPSGSVEVG